jgi:group I intron endonuclease
LPEGEAWWGVAPTALLDFKEDYMSYCVYKHTSPSGKVYIGITCKKPEYRWNHGRGYWQNPHFTNAIEKYGWENFSHEILFSGLSKEEAELREIELIAQYDSTDRENGYNCELGGNAQGKTTDETRAKISLARKGKCVGEQHPLYGKHLSAETKRKLSMANRGKTKTRTKEHCQRISEVRRKPIICVETGITYNSALDAEIQLGINRGNIGSCCTGKRKTAGGFTWRHAM